MRMSTRCLTIPIAVMAIAACGGAEQSAGRKAQMQVPVTPAPASVESLMGAFLLGPGIRVVTEDEHPESRWIAGWLTDMLRDAGPFEATDATTAGSQRTITLSLDSALTENGPEAYRLSVRPDGIIVTAGAPPGLFYGAVSVWQLATAGERLDQGVRIPAVHIADAPRFLWRGLMLDSARHFVAPDFVRKMIDWMALHKLNVLHWHLTDDQGWRLEIRRYPRLTEVGAWRIPAGRDGDSARRYGGFYTQDEIREIVDYAARRQITIVPEIEMPGHAQAAIAAYPALGTEGAAPEVSSDWGIHHYLFNVEESTFDVLENILAEVMAMFPGEYIHVGGDEAVKEQWAASDRVQARMRELGIADETALQSYFIRRIEEYLNSHGRRLIGWDEILEGGIAPQATVMSWRGIDGAVVAATHGHDTVLSPAPTLYFDHRQSALPGEPPGRGQVVSLADVYRFDPMPDTLGENGERHVLGLQANLWSEHIRTEERLAYMAFPRAAAVAELAWSTEDRRSWQGFLERMVVQFERYRMLDMPFATSAFDVRAAAAYRSGSDEVAVELSNQTGFGTIRYTTDGSEVTRDSTVYEGTLDLPSSAVLSTAVYANGSELARTGHGPVDWLARRRFSHELNLCSERLVLSLEDDAPPDGERSVFLIDIMNPCWVWPGVDPSNLTGIDVAVGQVPFNFQIGAARDNIELREPEDPAGELEIRAGGCGGDVIARPSLRDARANEGVTVLSADFGEPLQASADLCFRFNTLSVEPTWAIDRVELRRKPDAGR